MKYLVVIPARGGSKGILHKNIYPINSKPLLEYSIECISKVDFMGDVVVSTDDIEIAEVAKKYDNVRVIDRPKEISGDKSKTEDALIHAILYMKENFGREYDAVVTFQATSPLRKPETVKKFLQKYEKNIEKYDALLTLSEDRSDFWRAVHHNFMRLFPDAPRRRQEREPLYVENSAIYVTKTESLLETHSVLGKCVNGYVIDCMEAVDINEFTDIYIAEGILRAIEGEKNE